MDITLLLYALEERRCVVLFRYNFGLWLLLLLLVTYTILSLEYL